MKRLLALLVQIHAVARTRRELYGMSDHMLRDIGLRREQIPFIRPS
jgi:uncharacterized protein YjiS (DUF1127 family)